MNPETAHRPLLERGGEVRRLHLERIERPTLVLDLGRHLAALATEAHDDLVLAPVVVGIPDHVRHHLVERELDREEIARADTVLLAELIDERGEPFELRQPALQNDRGARGHGRHARLYTPGTPDPSDWFARRGRGRLQRADRDVAQPHAAGNPLGAAPRTGERARRRRPRARHVGGVHGAVEGARYRALSRRGSVLRRRERGRWHRRPTHRDPHLRRRLRPRPSDREHGPPGPAGRGAASLRLRRNAHRDTRLAASPPLCGPRDLSLLSLHRGAAAAGATLRSIRPQSAGLVPSGERRPRGPVRADRARADRGLLPGRRLWAERLGRRATRAGGVRARGGGGGHVPPRYPVRRELQATGRNHPGRSSGGGGSRRYLWALCRIRARHARRESRRADRERVVRREREPARPPRLRRYERRQGLHPPAGEHAGRPELRGHRAPRRARVSRAHRAIRSAPSRAGRSRLPAPQIQLLRFRRLPRREAPRRDPRPRARPSRPSRDRRAAPATSALRHRYRGARGLRARPPPGARSRVLHARRGRPVRPARGLAGRRTMRLTKLSHKTLLIVAVLFAVIAASTSVLSGWELKRRLTEEYRSKGIAIAKSIADSAVELILHGQAESVQATIDQFLDIPGVSYVLVTNGAGEVISHTFAPEGPAEIQATPQEPKAVRTTEIEIAGRGRFLDVSAPVLAGIAGFVHVGMDESAITAVIWSATTRMQLLLLAIFVASLVAASVLVRGVAEPLTRLAGYAGRRAETGVEGPVVEIDPRLLGQRDEVGALAASFRHMETELRRSAAELKHTTAERSE